MPATRRVLDLVEEDPLLVPERELEEGAARLIYSRYNKQLEIDAPSPWNNRSYKLRSKGWVGQLPVSADLALRIQPKVPIDNLFRMLEYAYDLKSFQLLPGSSRADSLEEVFESLASVLAHRVLRRLQQGLYRGYLLRAEPLPFIRGRVQPGPSLRGSLRGATRLWCSYQENTADLEDNRILGWTLMQLSRMPIRREEVKVQIRRAYRGMAQAVEIDRVLPADCVHRFYDRLNEDYRPMHALCRFFLDHCGPRADGEAQEFLPFMLHMPRLYERFVERWLAAHLPAHLRVQGQYSASIEEGGPMKFKIDLVLSDRRSGETLAVVDVKYKRPESPSEGDIQQVVAYAVRMGARRAFLVYPSQEVRRPRVTMGAVRVETLCFRVDCLPDEAGGLFREELLARCAGGR